MVLPVNMRTVAGRQNDTTVSYVVPKFGSHPEFVVVTHLSGVEAYTMKFRSWAWQKKNMPAEAANLVPSLRCFVEGSSKNVLRIAAENGWWQLPKHVLDMIVKIQGYEVSQGATLLEAQLSL